MALTSQIDQDLNDALKAGDQAKLSVLRMLKSNLQAAAKDKKADLTDDEVTKIIQKEVKQRKESVASFKEGGRAELADKEEAEAKLLGTYLPEQMDEAELEKLVETTIAETGASSMADMGKVMGALNRKLAGKADPSQVAQMVKQRLGAEA